MTSILVPDHTCKRMQNIWNVGILTHDANTSSYISLCRHDTIVTILNRSIQRNLLYCQADVEEVRWLSYIILKNRNCEILWSSRHLQAGTTPQMPRRQPLNF